MDTVHQVLRPERRHVRIGLASVLGLVVALQSVPLRDSRAQDAWSPPPEQSGAQYPEAERLSAPQLEQLLAPIALYPDVLLSQILMASTYPLEVIEAYRWVSDPANAQLQGAALEAALQAQDWDPSVKSLVPYPDILKTMNDKLGWMQQLGDAFLVQEDEVMDTVQRLRAQAAAAGNLHSNSQQTVVTEQRTIIIQPASPTLVYLPYYDPLVVYGPWPWPAYPPVFFEPFPRYAIHSGIFTWFSFGTVSLFWGWSSWDWHHHHIHIDRHRYERLSPHHRHTFRSDDTWVHDPYHRRGVAYRNPTVRARFRPNPPGPPATRLGYRGYQSPPTSGERADRSEQPIPVSKPLRSTGGVRTSPLQAPSPPRASTSPAQSKAPARTAPAQTTRQPTGQRSSGQQRSVRPVQAPPPGITTPPVQVEQRTSGDSRTAQTGRVPPAFEYYTNGAAARGAAERAQTSRQSPVARTPVWRRDTYKGDRGPGNRRSRN